VYLGECCIYFLIVQMLRPLRITKFSMCQGAFANMRRVFDYKSSTIFILDVEVVPQSCIPEVQICFSIAM
jgi:hypothetical protein